MLFFLINISNNSLSCIDFDLFIVTIPRGVQGKMVFTWLRRGAKGHDLVGDVVGWWPDDLEGLFQHEWFYGSVKSHLLWKFIMSDIIKKIKTKIKVCKPLT